MIRCASNSGKRNWSFLRKRGERLKILRNCRLGDAYAKLLLRTLDDHIGESKTWTMTIPQLADEMECSEATVERRVKDLCERRLLIVEAVDIEAQKYEFQIVFSNLQDWIPEARVRPKTKRRGRRRKPLPLASEAQPEASNFEQGVGNSQLTDPNFEQGVGNSQLTNPNSQLTDPNCQLTNLGTSYKRPKSAKKSAHPPNPPEGGGVGEPPRRFRAEEFPIPVGLDTPEFREAWREWCEFRRHTKRKPISEPAARLQMPDLERAGPAAAVEAIHKAIKKDWQGLVLDTSKGNPDDRIERKAQRAENALQRAFGRSRRRSRVPLKAILEALKPLQALCRDPKDAAALRIFAELLVDLPPADIETAVKRYLREADELWFPSPGKLRKLAMEAAEGELPEWQHAWHRIMEAARIWDRYDRERAVAAREHVGEWLMAFVKNLGGFIALASVDADTLSVLLSHFRQFLHHRKGSGHKKPGVARIAASGPREAEGKPQ